MRWEKGIEHRVKNKKLLIAYPLAKTACFLLPAFLKFAIRNSKFEISSPSHPKLRKKVPRRKNSYHPDQDVHDANPGGFHIAIAEDTEQRIGDKNEPSDRGEQNQYKKVVHVTLSYEVHIEQRTGNQEGAYDSAREGKTSDSGCAVIRLRRH